LKELGQIVEVDGDARVLGAVSFFVDFKRAAHQGLGLSIFSTSYEVNSQLVQ
jgi:hypothetical protein